MTMSGQQRSHRLQSGKRFLNLAVLMLVVCSTFGGCMDQIASVLPGPGRSDWELQLSSQYYIIKANSYSKKLCKASDIPGVYENVLTNFYVTEYCVFEPFITIKGISTEGLFATEEELASNSRQYYLLGIRDGNLYGPYDTEDALMESDVSGDISMSLVWELVPH